MGNVSKAPIAGGKRMVMRRNRLWTDEEVLELRRLADEHLRVSAIARRLNRTVAAIRHKAWLEGISLIERRARI
ncbi:MAG: hypothetical protein ABWZ57_18790 [Mesorhizobium sp.]